MTANRMSNTVFFRFTGPDEVAWHSPDQPTEQGTLTEFAVQAAGRRLVLIAAGESCLLTQVAAPNRNRSAWLKAIPYALEDNLAEDVEDLHFAVGPAGAVAPVAVISHATLEGWLDTCAQVSLAPSAVIPEPLLLPYQEDAWSILLEEQRAVARTGRWDGFVATPDELPLLLELALAEAGEQAPATLRVWGEATPTLTTTLPLPIQAQDAHPEPLPLFAANYDPAQVIDLLQGPYSRQAHLGKWLRPWRAAAVLAGLWFGLQAVQQVGEYWQLQQERTALGADMIQVYKDAVPDARKIVNPRVQLENRLRELRGGGGTQATFLDLLYRSGQPLTALDGVTLQGLRYRGEQLDLNLEGANLEALDRLKQRFNKRPDLEVDMRTTKRDDKIQSQVTLKRTAS